MSTHAGRIAVVTGAARGFGRAFAEGLADRGALVVAVDLEPPAETVAGIVEAGGQAIALGADVADPDAVAGLADAIRARAGAPDILVNNAGIMGTCPFEELEHAALRRMVDVNLGAPFLMTKALVPGMVEHGRGRIVNVASSSLLTTTPGIAAYMASKGAVLGLTSGLANDLGRHGITVNAVSPGFTVTPGVAADIAAGALPPDVAALVVAQQVIPRAGTPQDLVGAVLFLTSDDAAFMTGQFLVVDGGMTRR